MTLNVQKCLYNSEFLIESEARIVGIATVLAGPVRSGAVEGDAVRCVVPGFMRARLGDGRRHLTPALIRNVALPAACRRSDTILAREVSPQTDEGGRSPARLESTDRITMSIECRQTALAGPRTIGLGASTRSAPCSAGSQCRVLQAVQRAGSDSCSSRVPFDRRAAAAGSKARSSLHPSSAVRPCLRPSVRVPAVPCAPGGGFDGTEWAETRSNGRKQGRKSDDGRVEDRA